MSNTSSGSDEQPRTATAPKTPKAAKAAKHPKRAKRKKPATPAAPEEPETPETPAPATGGELVRQAHGGALKRGGTNPGGGRPPSLIRAEIRADFDEMRTDLKQMFFDKRRTTVKPRDRIRIAELFAKYGLEENISRTDVMAALQGTIQDIRSFLPPESASALLSMIQPRWRALW